MPYKDGSPNKYKIRPDGKNATGRPRAYQTAQQLEDKINEYFKQQDTQKIEITRKGSVYKTTKPYMFVDLLLHCFYHRDSASPYIEGEYDKEDTKTDKGLNFSDILKRAKDKCLVNQYTGATIGVLDSRMVALNLQSNYGYSTKQNIDADVTAKQARPLTREELEAQLEAVQLEKAQELKLISE